jgi:hypothetical protein
MERYNSRLEGYEAMTALEVIEHLDPHILSRFGVVTMGTYRPRILLVTTPVSLSSLESEEEGTDGRISILMQNSRGRSMVMLQEKVLSIQREGRRGCLGMSYLRLIPLDTGESSDCSLTM